MRRKKFIFLKRKRNYLADNLTEHSKQSEAKAIGLAIAHSTTSLFS